VSEFLLELFCEEIPARMQAEAMRDLGRLLTGKLDTAGLPSAHRNQDVTPRRLAVIIPDLPAHAATVNEERRGPRVDAPAQAIDGFLRATGLTRDQLEERDDPKGRFLYAVIEKPGRPATEIIAEIVPQVIRAFPWPKSMRWGGASASNESLRWVRPLQSILCLLDGAVVPFSVDGIASGNTTRGHRMMANETITVASVEDYRLKLHDAWVMLAAGDRMAAIEAGARARAHQAGLELIDDQGLLAENAGLTEWPVPLLGAFDPAYLDVPPEVIQLTMRTNQKYFALRDASGKLAPNFICVANIVPSDGGAAIVAGNERVLSARLSDAKFFWDTDRRTTLESRLPKLADIVFHEELGTVRQRVDRLEALINDLAGYMPTLDVEQARLAARLCKADLVSGVVGEFPEVQGIHGAYLARAEGLPDAVATAIADHYSPKGAGDSCPAAAVSVAVALAEKIDTLVGFFGIEERPTGSKDPFALRRAALGVIMLVVGNDLRLPLYDMFRNAWQLYVNQGVSLVEHEGQLLDFFADRLKVQQREAGVRHDLIDAVFSLGGEDDLVRLLARVKALQGFVETGDGANLLAGYRRAANILRIEEKKDGRAHDGAVDAARLAEPAEIALFEATGAARGGIEAAVAVEDFAGAMAVMAALRAPVDAFFDGVTVNADDAALRANRLRLLNQIRATMHLVADFSKIEG